MSFSIFCLVKKCSEQIKDSSIVGYLMKAYSEEISCLCTSHRFGSYVYTIFLAIFGLVLTFADICRTITNGPLPVCKARMIYRHDDWFVCPRLERDISLFGSVFNLLMYILLLLGLSTGRTTLLLPWLGYKIALLIAISLVSLLRLLFFRVSATKWEMLILAFGGFNILQVLCTMSTFH